MLEKQEADIRAWEAEEKARWAKQEQEMGNYKLAHTLLFKTHQDLKEIRSTTYPLQRGVAKTTKSLRLAS